MKLVSIITVLYNVGESIIPTFDSVRKIKNENIEYIVIDGGSKDNTINVINHNSDIIDIFVSEPDRGIYDAMNKGIERASGSWIIFINCGDMILSIPYEKLNNKYDAVVGCTVDENGNVFYPSYDSSIEYGNKLPHQGLFYNKKVKPKFNIIYRIFADYDLNLRMYKSKKDMLLIDDVIAQHNLDGISMNKKYLKEMYCVVKANLGLWAMFKLFLYYRIDGVARRLRLR